MITLKNVSKHYGDIQAVRDVSLTISKGEIVGLLGHNGAGKTTVMKMITGFLEPSEGSITLGGIDVLEDRLGVQQLIGYMPENAPLYHEMTVQEYLLMMSRLRGIAVDKEKDAISEAVKATGLEALMTRPIGTLSKGYRQRVGICQAILHKPRVLILDEPTNGLDPVQIVEIRHLIKKLAQNATVILSTHILPEIEAVCDRVVILVDGALAKDAPLRDFLISNQIRISIPAEIPAAQVETITGKDGVTGIQSVKSVGSDPVRKGFVQYLLTWSGDVPPVPAVIEFGARHGWTFGTVTDTPPSLESAFSRLMEDTSSRAAAKEDAA